MKTNRKTEAKFLEENYIETILKTFNPIKNKDIKYEITRSDREYSNSVYVSFLVLSKGVKQHRQFTLRISDHIIEDCIHKQFIIKIDKPMSTKRRLLFIKTLQNVMESSILRNLKLDIKNINDDTSTNDY